MAFSIHELVDRLLHHLTHSDKLANERHLQYMNTLATLASKFDTLAAAVNTRLVADKAELDAAKAATVSDQAALDTMSTQVDALTALVSPAPVAPVAVPATEPAPVPVA